MKIGREGSSSLNETVIGRCRIGVSGSAGIIEGSKNARRSLLLDQVADNLVVEELDRCPFDLFPIVLFLFPLQCQLDEDLLQLLVDVVDAELFERVILKDFKAEDILMHGLSENPGLRGDWVALTRIPIMREYADRVFKDTLTRETIHSKRLL